MSFAENLQFLRKQKEITQEQLAEILEVSRQSVSKWVSAGIGFIILGISVMEFLTGAGMSEEFALVIFFIMLIVAVMIFVVMGMQMEHFMQRHPVIKDFYSEEEKDQAYRKFTVRIAAIFCGITVVVLEGEGKQGNKKNKENKE